MRQFLIGYDITDEKRLQKVHRAMSRFALPIQYSVFLFDGTEQQLNQEIKSVLDIINKKQDDLRIYELPSRGLKVRMGKAVFPEGIILTSLPICL